MAPLLSGEAWDERWATFRWVHNHVSCSSRCHPTDVSAALSRCRRARSKFAKKNHAVAVRGSAEVPRFGGEAGQRRVGGVEVATTVEHVVPPTEHCDRPHLQVVRWHVGGDERQRAPMVAGQIGSLPNPGPTVP